MGIRRHSFTKRVMEWTVRGGGGVTVPGGVKDWMWCHGRVDKAVFAHRLDPMISKVCSK